MTAAEVRRERRAAPPMAEPPAPGRQSAVQLAAAAQLLPLVLLLLAAPAVGQGLAQKSVTLGASGSQDKLASMMARVTDFKRQYHSNPRSACSERGGSLCASSGGDDDLEALSWITSAQSFDARDKGLVSRVRDQGRCQTCLSFALIGAAEGAVSAALGTKATGRAWSVQALHFCVLPGKREVRTCQGSGVNDMRSAIQAFVDWEGSGNALRLEACLPYTASAPIPPPDLCKPKCSDSDPDLSKGSFMFRALASMEEIQAHIRQWGGVITRMDIWTDFKSFFSKNPDGVYPGPGSRANFSEGHAVLLVGYDNAGQYWVVKNSWGTGFARGGFAKVSFQAGKTTYIASVTDSFGLMYTPDTPRPIPYRLDAINGRAGCFRTTPPAGTWLWDVANALSLDLRVLVKLNIATIAVERPLDGQTPLLVCGIDDDILKRTVGRYTYTPPAEQGVAQAYITLKLKNQCPAGVNVDAAVVIDDAPAGQANHWFISGFKTIKPGESIEFGKMTNRDFYMHATVSGDPNCDSGLCWRGDDLQRAIAGTTYGFMKQTVTAQPGEVMEWAISCDDYDGALWVKACPEIMRKKGGICFSYLPEGENKRKVTCLGPDQGGSTPQLLADTDGSTIIPDWNSQVTWRWSSDSGEDTWQALNVGSYLSGYVAEFYCDN